MIPFFGNLALWLSLFFASLQFILAYKQNPNLLLKFNNIVNKGLLISILISFLSLMYCHIISDFSVLNVYQNSHTTKPLLYKISGVWGNHEGSMLLWIFVLIIFNYFIHKIFGKKNLALLSKALEVQALIIIGFLLFSILTSNPFEIIFPVPSNGLGFNPLLQDPALAIHPPLLYIGYVGFSAAFSLGIASMSVSEKERVNWHSYMKPFVVAAWSFLTLGIALGSIWAYYELGWGGWWFWDPVENASLMPWLLGTALIHSLITVEKKKSLQTWVLLLSILTFLLSVTGTFLVRSGILTSVHTFALDPERGIYILAFIALLGGYSLLLYGLKSKNFLNKNYLSFLSREGLILANNIIMMIVCATVFLGTMYPLLIEAFSNNKISVGEPYFNSTVVPIMIPAILIMGIGPILSWGDKSTKKKLKILSPAIFLTFISTIIFVWLYNSFNLFGIIGTIMSFWIISNIIVTQIQHLQKKFNINKIKTNIIPKSSLGMTLAHLGIGLLILGITGSSVWQKEKIVKMNINDETFIHDYKIIFKEVKKNIGPNYISLQGNFLIYAKNNQLITELKPENRFYLVAQNSTTEASIHTNIFRDLYIVLGDGDINNGWIIRIYYNPLVIWIWIGVVAIFVGGLFSLKKNIGIIKKIPV
jgi:cytochrome c-type biogenesis protein CcmF